MITINLDYLDQLCLKMLLYLMVVMKYLKCKIISYDEVIKKHESNVKSNEQSPILIYANRILNRLFFRTKTGYKLELLTNEIMRLLGDGPIIDITKNGENVSKLEIVRNLLVFCNLVENVYLQDRKLLSFLFLILDSEVYFLLHHKC